MYAQKRQIFFPPYSLRRLRAKPGTITSETLQERNFKEAILETLLFEESAPSRLIHQSPTTVMRVNISKFRV